MMFYIVNMYMRIHDLFHILLSLRHTYYSIKCMNAYMCVHTCVYVCIFSFETGVWTLLGLSACNFTDMFQPNCFFPCPGKFSVHRINIKR